MILTECCSFERALKISIASMPVRARPPTKIFNEPRPAYVIVSECAVMIIYVARQGWWGVVEIIFYCPHLRRRDGRELS